MTRASNLAGFSTAIVPSSNLNVGVVTATVLDGDSLTSESLVVSGVSTLTNLAEVRSDDGTPGRIDYYCESSNAHYTRIQAAPHAEYSGSVTVTLPTIDGDLIVGNTASATDQNINTTGVVTTSSITATGNITAGSFIRSGGTSSQFLKADGSVDSNAVSTGKAIAMSMIFG